MVDISWVHYDLVMTCVEVLKYTVVMITWVHYDLGGRVAVPGVPGGHY